MKQFLLLLLTICLFISSVKAQSPVEYGLTAEGTWFMPNNYFQNLRENQSTFGAGFGIYASKNIDNKFSADLGITYRLNDLRQYYYMGDFHNRGYGGYGNYGYGNYGTYDPGTSYQYPYKIGWNTFMLKYIVLPFHLNYHIDTNFFIRGGMEAAWLTNYKALDKALDEKTTFNWTVGLGFRKNKLKWSLNYIRGFKDVEFADKQLTSFSDPYVIIHRNRMIQFSISYPIFQKK